VLNGCGAGLKGFGGRETSKKKAKSRPPKPRQGTRIHLRIYRGPPARLVSDRFEIEMKCRRRDERGVRQLEQNRQVYLVEGANAVI